MDLEQIQISDYIIIEITNTHKVAGGDQEPPYNIDELEIKVHH